MFRWFRKHYLVSYEAQKFQALNVDGVNFNMNIKTVYPFGIVMRSVEVVKVQSHNDIEKTLAMWDEIIRSGKPIS